MPKVILQGHILVHDADMAVVQRALMTHIALTRDEPGCLIFNVEQDRGSKNTFQVYEEFVDRAAFAAHQARAKASTWGQVRANLERHYQITESDEE